MNKPTKRALAMTRETIAKDVRAFLKDGGKITVVPPGETGWADIKPREYGRNYGRNEHEDL